MTDNEITLLAHCALDAAAKVVHDRLGIKTGDLAGVMLGGGEALYEMEQYIKHELLLKENKGLEPGKEPKLCPHCGRTDVRPCDEFKVVSADPNNPLPVGDLELREYQCVDGCARSFWA